MKAEELVHLAGVDDGAACLLQDGAGVHPQADLNVGVVQHPLKHFGVALQRHTLIGVLKVAVVPGQAHRHPGGGAGVDLLRLLAPLLHGVVDKDVLVDIVRNGGHLRVRVLPQF